MVHCKLDLLRRCDGKDIDLKSYIFISAEKALKILARWNTQQYGDSPHKWEYIVVRCAFTEVDVTHTE